MNELLIKLRRIIKEERKKERKKSGLNQEAFAETKYKLHKRPKHLKKLYASVVLDDDVISQIFNPEN